MKWGCTNRPSSLHSRLVDGFAEERGVDLGHVQSRQGLRRGREGQILPCDWEWPYQGVQYSLPADSDTTPTDFKKIAWGSTALLRRRPWPSSGLRYLDDVKTIHRFPGQPAHRLQRLHPARPHDRQWLDARGGCRRQTELRVGGFQLSGSGRPRAEGSRLTQALCATRR